MGWDAFATLPNGHDLPRTPVEGDWLPKDDALRTAFRRAGATVMDCCGTVDGGLKHGMLDVSTCGQALEWYTGVDAWPDDITPLTPEQVQTLARNAQWPDVLALPRDQQWPIASARAFLDTCAEHGLGIRFSY